MSLLSYEAINLLFNLYVLIKRVVVNVISIILDALKPQQKTETGIEHIFVCETMLG